MLTSKHLVLAFWNVAGHELKVRPMPEVVYRVGSLFIQKRQGFTIAFGNCNVSLSIVLPLLGVGW